MNDQTIGRIVFGPGPIQSSQGGIPFNKEHLDAKDAEIQRLRAEGNRRLDALELAWGLIANAYGGNWDEASDDWRNAATRWRDESLHPILSESSRKKASERPVTPSGSLASKDEQPRTMCNKHGWYDHGPCTYCLEEDMPICGDPRLDDGAF